mmetsp:Transcript_40191/g.96318  ORF Transcript_40191/g.96318 Transcript_40191/m.96318 type:complete len:513 (-) Transcript_40191:81-1619(-)
MDIVPQSALPLDALVSVHILLELLPGFACGNLKSSLDHEGAVAVRANLGQQARRSNGGQQHLAVLWQPRQGTLHHIGCTFVQREHINPLNQSTHNPGLVLELAVLQDMLHDVVRELLADQRRGVGDKRVQKSIRGPVFQDALQHATGKRIRSKPGRNWRELLHDQPDNARGHRFHTLLHHMVAVHVLGDLHQGALECLEQHLLLCDGRADLDGLLQNSAPMLVCAERDAIPGQRSDEQLDAILARMLQVVQQGLLAVRVASNVSRAVGELRHQKGLSVAWLVDQMRPSRLMHSELHHVSLQVVERHLLPVDNGGEHRRVALVTPAGLAPFVPPPAVAQLLLGLVLRPGLLLPLLHVRPLALLLPLPLHLGHVLHVHRLLLAAAVHHHHGRGNGVEHRQHGGEQVTAWARHRPGGRRRWGLVRVTRGHHDHAGLSRGLRGRGGPHGHHRRSRPALLGHHVHRRRGPGLVHHYHHRRALLLVMRGRITIHHRRICRKRRTHHAIRKEHHRPGKK